MWCGQKQKRCCLFRKQKFARVGFGAFSISDVSKFVQSNSIKKSYFNINEKTWYSEYFDYGTYTLEHLKHREPKKVSDEHELLSSHRASSWTRNSSRNDSGNSTQQTYDKVTYQWPRVWNEGWPLSRFLQDPHPEIQWRARLHLQESKLKIRPI